MLENKNNQSLENFTVLRDGHLDPDYHPTGVQVARVALTEAAHGTLDSVTTLMTGLAGNVALEARMIVFDALHKTHYRAIRHNLIEQKKREQFERSIGLIAVKRK